MLKKFKNSNLFSAYLLLLVQVLTSLALIPIIINNLGENQYSIWVFSNTIIFLLSMMGMGLTTTIWKNVASSKSDVLNIQRIVNTSLAVYVLIIIISDLFLFFNLDIIINYIKIDLIYISLLTKTIKIIIIIFNVMLITAVFDAVLFGHEYIAKKNILDSVKTIIVFCTSTLLVLNKYDISYIALTHLIVNTIFAIISYLLVNFQFKIKINFKYISFDVVRKYYSETGYYFLGALASFVVYQVDNLIISSSLGVAEIAKYAIILKLIELPTRFITKIVDMQTPIISRLYKELKYEDLTRVYYSVFWKTFFFSLVVVISIYFMGQTIVYMWINYSFTINHQILIIFLIFMFFQNISNVSTSFILAMGIHKSTSLIMLVEVILNIIFSLILIKYFGLVGVAMGTLLSHLATNAWFAHWKLYRHFKGLK